jgi:hypothetical protein
MLLIGIGIYLLIVFVLTIIQVEDPPSVVRILMLSLVFTPIYGIYLVMKQRKMTSQMKYYYCQKCDYVYPVKLSHCPICEEKGEKVKLIKYENPHKLNTLYKKLSLA